MLIDFIEFEQVKIGIVRDDLYPLVGGGNKARKIQFIAKEIEKKGHNAIVSCGGIQSNHCRAVAVMSSFKQWSCKLILHGEKKRFFEEGGNAKLIRASGVEVEFVEPEEISMKMDEAMEIFRERGLDPYYLHGGGHEQGGGEAYVNALKELKEYCTESGWFPDYIFLASGTGSTQGGILAGLDSTRMLSKVFGISIARKNPRAENIVREFYFQLKESLSIPGKLREVIVLDNFIAGGYEKFNDNIREMVLELGKRTGIYTDPTYTGKAFWGMMETIKKEKLSGKVLFWHTGGINNLLTSNII